MIHEKKGYIEFHSFPQVSLSAAIVHFHVSSILSSSHRTLRKENTFLSLNV
jgi:hypothetical protein